MHPTRKTLEEFLELGKQTPKKFNADYKIQYDDMCFELAPHMAQSLLTVIDYLLESGAPCDAAVAKQIQSIMESL